MAMEKFAQVVDSGAALLNMRQVLERGVPNVPNLR